MMGETPHELVNPDGLLDPVGFSHAVVAGPGRTVYLGGQTGHRADESLADGLVDQYAQAVRNVATALDAAGARPEHLVSLTVYTTDAAGYRASLRELGRAHQAALGRHYPAMALFEVTGLFDPRSVVEIVGIAVVPDHAPPRDAHVR